MAALALPYLIAFCRVVIGLVFLASSAGKARDIAAFEQTIRRFRVVPDSWSWGVARLFVLAEIGIGLVTIFSSDGWWAGLLLAVLFLAGFSVLLLSVMSRGIQTACNCFGSSTRLVSGYDIYRNVGLIFCALVGLSAFLFSRSMEGVQSELSLIEWGLIGLGAATSLAIWLNLQDMVKLVRQN